MRLKVQKNKRKKPCVPFWVINLFFFFWSHHFWGISPPVCLGLFSPATAYPGSRFWNGVKRACAPSRLPLDSGGKSATPRSPPRPRTRVCPPGADGRPAVDRSGLRVPRVPRKPSCTPVTTLLKSQSGGHFVAASALSFHLCGLSLSPALTAIKWIALTIQYQYCTALSQSLWLLLRVDGGREWREWNTFCRTRVMLLGAGFRVQVLVALFQSALPFSKPPWVSLNQKGMLIS